MNLLMVTFCFISLADRDAIGRDLSVAWGDGSPARNLRVRCLVELSVEAKDDALGDRYFPNTTVTTGRGPAARHAARNQTRWREEIAVRGPKYRHRVEFLMTGEREASGGGTPDRRYNGIHSWFHDPKAGEATRYLGADPTTRPVLGYYLDMIGFPVELQGRDRNTAGASGEVYRLDALIPSGEYRLDGEATIDGLACVVLARPGLDRLWLSVAHGWAIVRRECNWSVGGPIRRRIDNRDFREASPGAWLPTRASMEIFGVPTARPGRRVATLRAEVIEVQADVPDSWFEPDFPPGTPVLDAETGDRMPFGVRLDNVDPAVVRENRYGPAFEPAPWWARPWGRWAVVLLMMVAGGWGLRRWSIRRGR